MPISKKVISGIILILFCATVLMLGCQNQTSVPPKDAGDAEEMEKISEGALQVIQTFMTCPNPDLYNSDMSYSIGGGEEPSEEQKESVSLAFDKATENWEKAVGEYFSEDSLQKFLEGKAYFYLTQEKEMQVKNVEPVERDERNEKVKVVCLVDGEEEEIELLFKRNEDGLIWRVGIWNQEIEDYI